MAGFFAISRTMLNQASKDREADRSERELLARSISHMAKASEKVAIEAALSRKTQEKGFEEAERRNGHLGELVSQGNKMTAQIVATLRKSADLLVTDTEAAASQARDVKTTLAKGVEDRATAIEGVKSDLAEGDSHTTRLVKDNGKK